MSYNKLKIRLGQGGEDGPCGKTASFQCCLLLQHSMGTGWDFGHKKGWGARSHSLPAA